MNSGNKRKDMQQDDNKPKRVKKECDYGERCYRRNPAHFREFSHRHLEAMLDSYPGTGTYDIPDKFDMERFTIAEQLDVIVEKQLYTPWIKGDNPATKGEESIPNVNRNCDKEASTSTTSTRPQEKPSIQNTSNTHPNPVTSTSSSSTQDSHKKPVKGILRNSPLIDKQNSQGVQKHLTEQNDKETLNSRNLSLTSEFQKCLPAHGRGKSQNTQGVASPLFQKSLAKNPVDRDCSSQGSKDKPIKDTRGVNKTSSPQQVKKDPTTTQGIIRSNTTDGANTSKGQNSSDYRPVVAPTRRVEDFLNVVLPKGNMSAKHAASAPYYIFYTTITAAKETHRQPYSITFQEILDRSLGELKCSLQINFMVELGWLLAQYYFAGYSEKKLTILYGEESPDLVSINRKKPHVDAHLVRMGTPFGKHHTKMMLLCYEDGSLRVVVSTANLYLDDWENRTQGLWFSPRCPELPPTSMPHDGDSPTMFKRSLLRYLNHYQLPSLTGYIERVKRCDFTHINVFLVASVPGSHFDMDWGMTRTGSLLRQHCAIPASETRQWPLIAQASSIGSYGKEPSLWLTGDFLHQLTKIKDQPQTLSVPPALKLIYPSLENVQQSHDGLLGGGCLPYAASAHTKQPWLNDFLYQWVASSTGRMRAMPHIKSYTRVSPDSKRAGFFLLTSGNVSKAAWGSINKGNAALRIMSYEAGVMFLPRFVINEDFFPLQMKVKNRLVLPYDVPPVKYTGDMSPWVSDYLM